MTRFPFCRRACLGLLLLLLLPTVVWAGFWGDDPPATLAGGIEVLTVELCDQVNLRREPVLISTNDFFDARSGLSLPLALLMRAKFISAMKRHGARVLLPGCDEDRYLILQGTWQTERDRLSLDVKIMRLGGDGPEAVAAASADLPLDKLDHSLLTADLDSWGRFLVRKLEHNVRNHRRHTLFLRRFQPRGGLDRNPDLGAYLDDWLRPALAESRLFRVLDPQLALKKLSVGELRTRGLAPRRKSAVESPAAGAGNLTADLVRADSELWGAVWRNHGRLEIKASILDPLGCQISAATVAVPEELFPGYLLAPTGPGTDKGFAASGAIRPVRYGPLTVELSSNRGAELPAFRENEQIRFLVRLNRRAHLYLFYLNPDGSVTLLYPLGSNYRFKPQSPALEAGHLLILPDDGCPYDLKAGPPFGRDLVLAVACEKRLELPSQKETAWHDRGRLTQSLRAQARRLGCGYAEAVLELITRP